MSNASASITSRGDVPAIRERRLRDLAGVGPAIEADLRALGVETVADLAGRNGDELYRGLCDKTGKRQDACVLDTFRCAVAQARDEKLPAEQRNWWWWSRQRKSGRPGLEFLYSE